MIDQLITALSKEVELSAEEIADTIWLALQMQESQSETVSSISPFIKEDKEGIDKLKIQSEQETLPKSKPKTSNSETTTNQPPEESKAGIYPRNQQKTPNPLQLSFKVPDAPSLREPLTLARALKPLMRRIASGRELVLDETATIQQIADEGLWLPVLRPTLEPWLYLELVVDEGISMQIWRHTIRELERLLKNYGIFRDVRVWGLITDEKEQVQIRRGIGSTAKNQTPRTPKELIDPSGRRLVLVVSDCVSSLWRNGKVTPILEFWAKQGSMAIVQMLPNWLWKRTALGRASEVRLRGLTPGVFNQKLIAKEMSLWDELDEETGVKVPVFTLEPDKVVTWAQMLSGNGSIWTSGYVFKLNATTGKKESGLFNFTHGKLGAEQRVQAFRVTASPMSRKLAGLLACAPVISLPIVRLIRETLLKDSLQVHVAEVFLGGLLKPLSEINADINPDYVQYEFIEEVRELLIDSVPSENASTVLNEVSKFVAKKLGLSLRDFSANLKNPQLVEDSNIAKEVKYFAMVTAQVLRGLGGNYAQIAQQLPKQQITDEQQKVSKISPTPKGITHTQHDLVTSGTRGTMVSQSRIFIGSSVEGRGYAECIGRILSSSSHGNIVTLPWWDRTCFPPNSTAIESLKKITGRVDGAILVVTPDDRTTQRGSERFTPLINVMLEYGLFLGCLGRLRIAIALVEGAHFPSDLAGVNYIRLLPMQGSSADTSYESSQAAPPVLAWLEQLSETPDLREGLSSHLQAIYNRSKGNLRVIIPTLQGGTGSAPGLGSANTSRITLMTSVEGMAYGWLLKTFSPMMRGEREIECLTAYRRQQFTQGRATFVIGSPSTNEATGDILARWYQGQITIEKTQDYCDVITYGEKDFRTEFNDNGAIIRDFSLLIYRSKDELFVCAGTSPFGTAGAVSMLTEPHEDQEVESIHEYIKNRQSFLAIGKVEVFSETDWSFSQVLIISSEANGSGDSE